MKKLQGKLNLNQFSYMILSSWKFLQKSCIHSKNYGKEKNIPINININKKVRFIFSYQNNTFIGPNFF